MTTNVTLASGERGEATRGLRLGHYFWRVRAGTSGLSETRELFVDPPLPVPKKPDGESFTARVEEALALATPLDGQEFIQGSGRSGIAFSWRGRDIAGKKGFAYRLEVSKTQDFAHPVIELETDRASIADKRLDLPPGRYFWRVRLLDPSGATIETSHISRFAYLPKPLPLPPRSHVNVQPDGRKR
jgi:hypothetical protein